MIRMPGKSYSGPLPELTERQQKLSVELEFHVRFLAEDIGPRNVNSRENLVLAERYLTEALGGMGYEVEAQTYQVGDVNCSNLIVEIAGTDAGDEIVIVGAHYDSCWFTPGADDNASAVAALLAMARTFAQSRPERTLRFALFVNEEPPYFRTEQMGSLVYARRCRERGENIVAMICLEMLGYFSDEPGSQRYPMPGLGLVYPTRGDFIAFVGNYRSRKLVREVTGRFRQAVKFPSEGAALPGWIGGVGLSDHWSFWQAGYNSSAIMVTDTAMFRNEHYHGRGDTPEKLDYGRMARVVGGLEPVVAALAKSAAADIQ